MEKYKVSGHK